MSGHGVNRAWLEDLTNCEKEVEWRSSANPLSIVSGEVPGKLKSPHIIRRSIASVSQIGKEQAELIKEHRFAGRRWAINVCQPQYHEI